MATADDRGAVSRPPGARAGLGRLGLVGFGLLIVLLAVALVQARQFSLLRQVMKSGGDYAVLTIYQAEIEYLRLREAWTLVSRSRDDANLTELKLRYEIWVSRVQLLQADRPQRLLANIAEHRETIDAVQRFIARADLALGTKPELEPSPAFLAERLPALQALGAPIHGLSLGAAHRVVEQMEQRNQAVQQHNQLGLGLTIFMSVLTLAFA